MATKILQPAKTQKLCDMCGEEKQHYFKSGQADMGFIQTQGDRWQKSINIKLTASIPYNYSDDICTDCARVALHKIISDIEGGC